MITVWQIRGMRKLSTAMVLAAALVLCATAIAARPHSGRFAGSTSGQGKTIKFGQDRSVHFSVSHGVVRGFKVGFKATCPSGTIDSEGVPLTGSFRVKDGRFSGTKKITDGGTGRVTGHFTSPRRASGTIRMRPVDSDEGVEGGGPEQCDSGLLTWTARLGLQPAQARLSRR